MEPRTRTRILGAAALGLALGLASACIHRLPLGQDWVRVRTAHLEIISSASAQTTLDLARDLEIFREVVSAATTMKQVEPRVPTRVYVLDPVSWGRLQLGDVAGFFVSGLRQNVLAMPRDGWGSQRRAILLHEYVHFLMENQQTLTHPLWFGEGWAELLSTMEITDEEITIGALSPARASWLLQPEWLSTPEVLAAEEYPSGRNDRARFYAQSLGLVHYLQLGRGDYDRSRAELASYLSRRSRGESVERAFTHSFGFPPEGAEAAIRTYLARGISGLRIPRERLSAPSPRHAEPLGPSVVGNHLGWLMLHGDPPDLARRYFTEVLMRDERNARAHCGLGTALGRAGEWTEAEMHLRRCLDLAPADPLAHLDSANSLVTRVIAEPETPDAAEWLEHARERCRESLRLDPELTEAQVQLGSIHLLEGGEVGAAAARPLLEQAHAQLPGNEAIRIRLALAYTRLGRRDDARALVARTDAHGGARTDRQLPAAWLEELDAAFAAEPDD